MAFPPPSPPIETSLAMPAPWRSPSANTDRLLAALLSILWALGVGSILLPGPLIAFLAGAGMLVFLIPAFLFARLPTLAVSGLLLGAAATLAIAYDATPSLWRGLERSILFTAFLPTLSLLRASARGDARLEAYRARVEQVPTLRRPAWIVSGSFVLASVLSVGASAIFAPLLRQDASDDERIAQARANVCGAGLAIIWSPFFIALAVVSDFLPRVPLAGLIAAGALIGFAGMLLGTKIYAPSQPLIRLGEALAALKSFAPPILLITVLVVVVRATTQLSTIETMLLILPVLCLLRIATRPGGDFRRAGDDVWTGMMRMRDDIAVVSAAMIFGTVLTTTPWMADLGPMSFLADAPVGLLMLGTILLMAAIGFLGVQPLVTGTICLVVLTGLDLGVSDLAIGLTVLVGWSMSAILSLSSLVVRVTAGQYGVYPERLVVGRNLAFFVAFLPLALLMIWVVDNLVSAFPMIVF